jgi:protein-disulfide isomerase-like protein with CxxC motif
MAAERGLVMKLPPVAPRTRLAFQAVELAGDHSARKAMHRAIFEAFFRDGRDIGGIDVLADIGASVGVAPALVKTALEAACPGARSDRCAGDAGRRRYSDRRTGYRRRPLRLAQGRGRARAIGGVARLAAADHAIGDSTQKPAGLTARRDQITFNAEAAEAAENKFPGIPRRALRALR